MKRVALTTILVLTVSTGVLLYRSNEVCAGWRETYKRFTYSEMLKNSPVIYSLNEIEDIIGPRPAGCIRPSRLTDDDIRRFGRENIGPNEFIDEIREARQRTSAS